MSVKNLSKIRISEGKSKRSSHFAERAHLRRSQGYGSAEGQKQTKFAFCRAGASSAEPRIRIGRGAKANEVRILPSGRIFGGAKDTDRPRGKSKRSSHFAERAYFRRSQGYRSAEGQRRRRFACRPKAVSSEQPKIMKFPRYGKSRAAPAQKETTRRGRLLFFVRYASAGSSPSALCRMRRATGQSAQARRSQCSVTSCSSACDSKASRGRMPRSRHSRM